MEAAHNGQLSNISDIICKSLRKKWNKIKDKRAEKNKSKNERTPKIQDDINMTATEQMVSESPTN